MKPVRFCSALAAVYFVIAMGCGPNGRSVNPVDTGRSQGPGGSQTSDPTRANGTVDGGGGAGYKGKPLERYKKDITTFPEYKKIVEPALKSIGKIRPEFEKLFVHIVRNRLWLFLDQPVPKISADRQGLPYNMDQWAVQNGKEIWMSNEYKGDEENRGWILMHEIFVGLKIFRFLSSFEYCSVITVNPDYCKGELNEAVVEHYKLNDLDHQDVRNLTDWLLVNHATMKPHEFSEKMHQHQFHSHHYSWRTTSVRDSLDVEPHLKNLSTQPVKLFANFGADRLAKHRCEFELRRIQGRELDIRVQYRDLQSGQISRVVDYSLKASTFQAHPTEEGRRMYILSLDEDRIPSQVGDRQKSLSISFDHDRIVEIFGGEKRVSDIKDGVVSWRTDSKGDFGINCERHYIHLPNNFERWQEMRQNDREIFERKRYHGKTLTEFFTEVMKNLPTVLKSEGWTGN